MSALCELESALGLVPVEVAFCADAEGNGSDWQACSFLTAVADGDGVGDRPQVCAARILNSGDPRAMLPRRRVAIDCCSLGPS